MKQCSVDGCGNKHFAKGYCSKHYSQWRRHGKIFERTIFSKNKIVAHEGYSELVLYNKQGVEVGRSLIDNLDVDTVSKYKWYLNADGYAIGGKDNRTRLHRFLLKPDRDNDIDHINNNRLDNRRKNLRECTRKENIRNNSNREGSSSQYKGVAYVARDNKYSTRIKVDGEEIWLGQFSSEIEAAKMYDKAAKKYFKEFANLNFKEEN